MRHLDRLHCTDSDVLIARALGLVMAGAFLLLWAGLRLMPKPIGA